MAALDGRRKVALPAGLGQVSAIGAALVKVGSPVGTRRILAGSRF